MIQFITIVTIFCGCWSLWQCIVERNQKGYIQGDSIGFLIASFIPFVNLIILFAICVVYFQVLFNEDRRFFKKK